MAIIAVVPSLSEQVIFVNGFAKVKTTHPGFTGTTYLVATCVMAGSSGVIEPAWAQLDTGAAFVDGSAGWKVTTIPAKPSMPNWVASTTYFVGQKIKARAVRLKAAAIKTVAPNVYKPWAKRVKQQSYFFGTVNYHLKQSQARRSWLSLIWYGLLLPTDRAAWISFATNFTLTNFKGVEKIYSGWELFEYCNSGVRVPGINLSDGQHVFDLTLPSYGSLPTVLPCWTPVLPVVQPHTILKVLDFGSGFFTIYATANFQRNLFGVAVWIESCITPVASVRGLARSSANIGRGGVSFGTATNHVNAFVATATDVYWNYMLTRPRPWIVTFRVAAFNSMVPSNSFSVPTYF